MRAARTPNTCRALPRRGSSLALGLLGILLLTCLAAVAHTVWAQRQAALRPNPTAAMVRALRLTDLTLFTEARYTRHLSQADAFSAFQDGPVALEHFPAGSLVLPNRTLPLTPHATLVQPSTLSD